MRYEIRGRVIDEFGNCIGGVRVEAWDKDLGLIRIVIWKDILSLTSAMKFAGLLFGIAIIGACYLDAEWWTTPVNVAPC